MRIVQAPEEVIHPRNIPPGSRVYVSGNAATPQALLRQLAADDEIRDIDVIGVLLLGDLEALFSEACCKRLTHRVIFNGPMSRQAVNAGWARYQLMHLSDIPNQLEAHIRPDVVLLSVAGPDNGGNYSLGTTVEGVPAAIESARHLGGLVVAERNDRMPFVLGTTVPSDAIDYLLDVDYPLPVSPVRRPDDDAKRVGEIIAARYIRDGWHAAVRDRRGTRSGHGCHPRHGCSRPWDSHGAVRRCDANAGGTRRGDQSVHGGPRSLLARLPYSCPARPKAIAGCTSTARYKAVHPT